MSQRLQNCFVCALAFIDILLCLLVTIRFSCNLIQANDTTTQLMEQLQERDKVFGVLFDQLMELDHEMFFAAYGQQIKPVSYDQAAECLESLESLNSSANFGRSHIEQSLQKQIGQIVNKGHDLITALPGVTLELSDDYQEMITGCLNSLKESRNQYSSEMIKRIKSAEKDAVRSVIMILLSVVVSVAIVVSLLILRIKQGKPQEQGCAKSSDT